MSKNEKLQFEDAMKQLGQIVDELERNEMPLEQAVELFQQGIELSKYCSNKLDEVERKISVIMQNADGGITEQDFNIEGVEE